MNLVEKVTFVSTLTELKKAGDTLNVPDLTSPAYKDKIDKIVEYFDTPAIKRLETLRILLKIY